MNPSRKRIRRIRHIGYLSLCSGKHHDDNIRRIDLGAYTYRRLGVFKDEKYYRVCERCIARLPRGR